MKAPHSIRLFAALAAFVGAALAASAQLTTFTTIPDYSGSDISGGAGKAYTQTFTHVLGVQSMTFRFVRTAGASATPVTWYFAEWDTATNRAVGVGQNQDQPIMSNVLSVPAVSSFTTYQYTDPIDGPINYLGYDLQLTLNATSLNATKTYALVLLNSSSNVKLQLIDGADNFPWGAAYTASGISSFANLQNTSSTAYAPVGTDWGFQQIVVDLAPVPEPATAAAGIGALLILGLVALRVYRRRQEQVAPALVPVKA